VSVCVCVCVSCTVRQRSNTIVWLRVRDKAPLCVDVCVFWERECFARESEREKASSWLAYLWCCEWILISIMITKPNSTTSKANKKVTLKQKFARYDYEFLTRLLVYISYTQSYKIHLVSEKTRILLLFF
jgi:hypothetical protein